jgi:hypothetical protein
MRGRRSNTSGSGSTHHHGNSGNSSSGGQQRRVNPRVQTFDSNGPEVRIRGNAFQINEKYLTLARDAASAGDRVLAESYLQHAEHYQRQINEMNEEFPQQNPNHHSQPQPQHQQPQSQEGEQPVITDGTGPQPVVSGMNDLDQGFLTRPRHTAPSVPVEQPVVHESAQPQPAEQGSPPPRQRHSRHKEPEAI